MLIKPPGSVECARSGKTSLHVALVYRFTVDLGSVTVLRGWLIDREEVFKKSVNRFKLLYRRAA